MTQPRLSLYSAPPIMSWLINIIMLLPYWNHLGQSTHFKSYPDSFHNWVLGEEVLTDHQDHYRAAQEILNHAIGRKSCKAMGIINIVRLSFLK